MTRLEELTDGEYISLAVSNGCLACSLDRNPGTPAEWHHPREKVGKSERGADRLGYPLCPSHHRTGVGATAVHLDPVVFKARYGNDKKMAKLTRISVQRILDSSIGMKRAR